MKVGYNNDNSCSIQLSKRDEPQRPATENYFAALRARLHCAYKISKFFTLVRRGCLHYTKRRLRA